MDATMPALLCFVARDPSWALCIVCVLNRQKATGREWGGCRLSITTDSPFVPRYLDQEAVNQAASSLPVSLSWQQLGSSELFIVSQRKLCSPTMAASRLHEGF